MIREMTGTDNNFCQTIKPVAGESPSEYADRLGVHYTSHVTEKHKKDLGQFFTPMPIAKFMADFALASKEKIKILDPGCGIGILSTALIEALANKKHKPKTIELYAFETDVEILPLAERCYEYLREWLQQRGIALTCFLCKNDFILHNSDLLTNAEGIRESYDIVISNPPYFKLPKDDERAIAAKAVIYGQSNIYTIFLLIASKLLNDNGQLIFITPRSFCSGSYFRLFREIFFSTVDLSTIHLFRSRKDAFKRDKVLQENIIIVASKKRIKDNDKTVNNKKITISSSKGIDDLKDRYINKYKLRDLINFNSRQKILHLPSSEIDEQIISIFKTWTGSLNSYGLQISTGPVVDFRSLDKITFRKQKDVVPLIWLHNIEQMKFIWPRDENYKGKPKGQFIISDESTLGRLVKNKNYVLLRRFSTKDDHSRLIASPYFKDAMPNMSLLGIENHLNYIYRINSELTNIEAVGLSALLNSKLFDLYFRTFNGNINVSATELRDFPLPSFHLIQLLGQSLIQEDNKNKHTDIDSLVYDVFNLSIDLSNIYG